ncbi:NrsF family protein [Erwinia amylovora]|uniref:NrsF family protein n=1 Tax=Erwinia amylovora TaxID=552 RepID=UPI001444759E|nr:NrsF family protein [Erwinia amylovora]
MRNHDRLIDQLSNRASPVKRTWATGWRVAAWIMAVLPCGMLSSWTFHSKFTDWSQQETLPALLSLLFSFIIGASAIAGAFNLSIAGRRSLNPRRVALLALLWLAANLLNASSTNDSAAAGRFGEGIHCYLFMLSASLPMMVVSIVFLYRTRSLCPVQSLALAGCGAAFMSSVLLSLCHGVHLYRFDFAMHLAAGITIIALTVLTGRKWIRLG